MVQCNSTKIERVLLTYVIMSWISECLLNGIFLPPLMEKGHVMVLADQ